MSSNGRPGQPDSEALPGPAPAPYNGIDVLLVLFDAIHHARARLLATMKAAGIDRFGPPKVLTLHDLPVPKPGPRDLLIATHAAAVSGWDAEVRSGSWWPGGRRKFPLVLGSDGAGIVAAKGARVRRFRVGDRVWAINPRRGFYAEYAVVNASTPDACRGASISCVRALLRRRA